MSNTVTEEVWQVFYDKLLFAWSPWEMFSPRYRAWDTVFLDRLSLSKSSPGVVAICLSLQSNWLSQKGTSGLSGSHSGHSALLLPYSWSALYSSNTCISSMTRIEGYCAFKGIMLSIQKKELVKVPGRKSHEFSRQSWVIPEFPSILFLFKRKI